MISRGSWNLERRAFFRVLGAFGAAISLPPALVEATQPIPTVCKSLGLVREVGAYDLPRDRYIVRLDVYAKEKGIQLYCDYVVDANENSDKAARKAAEGREVAFQVLTNEMKHRGIQWSDLAPLELPAGYARPAWLTKP